MLVITILVLAILAATVIMSLSNTNIISETQKTVFKSNMSTYKQTYDIYLMNSILSDVSFDETKVNLKYEDTKYGEIFGEVPDKYKEGLKVIKGKIVYITEDEDEIKIIQELGMMPDEIKIINRLVHCTTSNAVDSVAYDTKYTTTLTVDAGYTLQKVTVVMGGVDITSSVYNSGNKTITIANVTDDVVITATTDANTYTITPSLTEVVSSNTALTAKMDTSYITKLTAKNGHTLTSVSVSMAGVDVTSEVYDRLTNEINIPKVTGDVIIVASATANVYSITYDIGYMTSTNTATNIQYGKSYTTTLNLTDDYVLETINVVMNSLDITKSAYNEKTGKITIEEVTGDIELIAKNHIDVSMVPEEFYYVGGTKSTGLVISDNSKDENKGVDYTCVGNQFVWVPVDDYSKFVRGTPVMNSDGIYKMTGSASNLYEPYESGYASEQSEYSAMCASVEKYGGFYIARFEAGDGGCFGA